MRKTKKLRVAIFFGGTSKEREVSLHTGRTAAQHLDTAKYEVIPVEISAAGKWLLNSPLAKKIRAETKSGRVADVKALAPVAQPHRSTVDVALLALHGPGGEDGTIQGMLELLGIPYTCSGVLASAVAMDKARTKRLVAAYGVTVLPDAVLHRRDTGKNLKKLLSAVGEAVVIKPNRMGSSIGVTIATGAYAIRRGIAEAFRHDDEILIEPFVSGREITVPVLGNHSPKALSPIEIIPWKKSSFYDFSAKYKAGGSEHLIPAPLTRRQSREVADIAITAHTALGCRGVTRSDFILGKNGKFYFLEINTIPGMTPTSLVPQAAAAAGISFTRLLDKLIALALEK